MRALSAQSIVAGVPLEQQYPELENCLMLCATETKTEEDINTLVDHMARSSTRLEATKCPTQPKMA